MHLGGPTGVYTDRVTGPVELRWHGQGTATKNALPARRRSARTTMDADFVRFLGPWVPGDSGGGVITADGRAVGVGTDYHAGGDLVAQVDRDLVEARRLGPAVARAEQRMGITLRLVTAPLLDATVGARRAGRHRVR